jgi:hypothetical protein
MKDSRRYLVLEKIRLHMHAKTGSAKLFHAPSVINQNKKVVGSVCYHQKMLTNVSFICDIY